MFFLSSRTTGTAPPIPANHIHNSNTAPACFETCDACANKRHSMFPSPLVLLPSGLVKLRIGHDLNQRLDDLVLRDGLAWRCKAIAAGEAVKRDAGMKIVLGALL